MKIGRKIQWVQAIDEQPYNEKVLAENDMSGIRDSILRVVFALIYMASGILAVTDVYELELPSVAWMIGVVSVLLVVSIALDALPELDYPWVKYTGPGILGIGLAGFGIYLLINGGARKVLGGIVAFLRLYFRQWSGHYDVAVSWYAGDERYIEEGVYFVIFIMFFVAVWVAKQIKNNGFMVLFPVMIIVAELLVGRFPGRGAVLLLLAGVLLNHSGGWNKPDMQSVSLNSQDSEGKGRILAWLGTSIIIVAVCSVILLVGIKPAEHLIEQNKEREIPEIRDLVQTVAEWKGWENYTVSKELADALKALFEKDTEEITNDTPVYAHVPVFEMEAGQKPEEDIYVKDFVGVHYENGIWKTEDSDSDKSYLTEDCLAVPENLSEVKALAAVLEMQAAGENTAGMSEDEIRMRKAELLTEWMEGHTVYSLVLPKLPAETDPIEYFLGTTKTGYCMHYAGASVMILREMGVPTRFVSGYLVDRDSFEKTEEGYKAVVLDDRAHAWVEIYLEQEGWVQVDVTPGAFTEEVQGIPGDEADVTGGSGEIGSETSGTVAEGNGQTVAVPGMYGPTEGSEKVGTSSENIEGEPMADSETVSSDSEVLSSENAGEASEHAYGPNVIPKDPNEQEEEEEPVHWLIVAIVVSLVVLVGTTFMVAANTHKFFTLESRYYKQIKKAMRSGNHKQSIIKINKAICRKLQFKKLLQPGNNDEEYESVLKTKYNGLPPEDWDRYMDIVKAATFSKREFTGEEVKFCYEVYRDIIYKDEVW